MDKPGGMDKPLGMGIKLG